MIYAKFFKILGVVVFALASFRTGMFYPLHNTQALQADAPEDSLLDLYPLQSGFPVNTLDWVERCSPIIADIDNDDDHELLVGDYRGRVYVWDAVGVLLPGYPVDVDGHIIGHLALADLDGNGNLEIVAGVGSLSLGASGHVYIWRPDGTTFPGWPKSVARYGDERPSKISTVAVADLDGDQDLEIIAGTNNNDLYGTPSPYTPNLYAWHHDGTLVTGWPREDTEHAAILGTLGVGDFSGNGQMDVVVARDYHRIFAYDWQGNDLPAWPISTYLPEDGVWNFDPRIVHRFSTPTLADLNDDGTMEYIVAGYRRSYNDTTFYNNDLLVYQPDGTRLSGWEIPAGGSGVLSDKYLMQQAPAIADLNGDGNLEIVVPTQDGWIRAYKVDKTLLWQFNYAQGHLVFGSEPVIGDVDGDGYYEVVFGTYDPTHGSTRPIGLWILEHNGLLKSGTPLSVAEPGIFGAPALGDLDGDGDLDIAAATSKHNVYVWDTPTPYVPEMLPWPVARFDIRRTAMYRDMAPSLEQSVKSVTPSYGDQGQTLAYTIDLIRTGMALPSTVYVTDTVPSGLNYVSGSLQATSGSVDESQAPVLLWFGSLAEVATVRISYDVEVEIAERVVKVNAATIDDSQGHRFQRSISVILNGEKVFLPFYLKEE